MKSYVALEVLALTVTMVFATSICSGCSGNEQQEKKQAGKEEDISIREKPMLQEEKTFSLSDDSIAYLRETTKLKDFIELFHYHVLSFCPNQEIIEKN